jgi:hypothetical protein
MTLASASALDQGKSVRCKVNALLSEEHRFIENKHSLSSRKALCFKVRLPSLTLPPPQKQFRGCLFKSCHCFSRAKSMRNTRPRLPKGRSSHGFLCRVG